MITLNISPTRLIYLLYIGHNGNDRLSDNQLATFIALQRGSNRIVSDAQQALTKAKVTNRNSATFWAPQPKPLITRQSQIQWLTTMERRSGVSRRKQGPSPKYPFNDANGEMVTRDRRMVATRRLTEIKHNWLWRSIKNDSIFSNR